MRWVVFGFALILVIVGIAGGANPEHTLYAKPTLPAPVAISIITIGGALVALALVGP
jgi:hypothetical protein